MRAIEFHSCVAAELQRFVALRRAGGSDYQAQTRLLLYFDRFLMQRSATKPCLTREITEAYQETLGRLHPRTRDNRLSVVRQFCEYLSRTDPRCYIPERCRGIGILRSDGIASRPSKCLSRNCRSVFGGGGA